MRLNSSIIIFVRAVYREWYWFLAVRDALSRYWYVESDMIYNTFKFQYESKTLSSFLYPQIKKRRTKSNVQGLGHVTSCFFSTLFHCVYHPPSLMTKERYAYTSFDWSSRSVWDKYAYERHCIPLWRIRDSHLLGHSGPQPLDSYRLETWSRQGVVRSELKLQSV